MATQAAYQEQQTGLNSLVRQWDRRQRWQQTIFWLPRSLLPGLFVGIALFVTARLTPLPAPPQLAIITTALTLAGLLVMLGVVCGHVRRWKSPAGLMYSSGWTNASLLRWNSSKGASNPPTN